MSEVENKKDLIALGNEITTIPLVIEKNSLSVANIEPVKQYINELEKAIEEKKKNELSWKGLDSFHKEVKTVFENFDTFRKGYFSSWNSVPKEFTSLMNNDWTNLIDGVKSEVEERKESIYVLADANIKSVLDGLLDAEDEKVKKVFDTRVLDFSKTRTNVTAQLSVVASQKENESDEDYAVKKAKFVPKIRTPLRTAVQKILERALKPIRETIQLEELKAKEQQTFEEYLPSATINSIEEGKALLITLAKQKESIDRLYPNTTQHSHRTLNNKVQQVESNIRVLEAIKAKDEAEAEVKALGDADLPVLGEAKLIADAIEANASDKNWLNMQLQAIQGLVHKLSFRENIETLKNIQQKLSTKIKLLNEDGMIVDISTSFDEPKEEVQIQKIWSLKDAESVVMDIEFMGVAAESKDEAIEKMVDIFRKSLIENGVKNND